jgi:glycosyltransferase involved in cell wall biosynthesis
MAMPFLRWVEGRSIRRADTVNLVSPGFEEYFRRRFPTQRFSFFTNGIDPDFIDVPCEGTTPAVPGGPLTVLYAGNVGEGQGLHAILPALARASSDRLRFRIIGDGARMDLLARAVAAAGVDNVELLPPMTRLELIGAYRHADVLFLHLNDYDAFRKVLPSKIFEYAALGKPLWAGVAGYAADFVRQEIPNAAVFAPCDVAGALRSFDSLVHRVMPRTEFVAKFGREEITRQLAADILSAGDGVQSVVHSLDALPQL